MSHHRKYSIEYVLAAIGILIAYTVSNIYLEHVFGRNRAVVKTAFFFVYFLVWIIPLVYFWIKDKISENAVSPILVLCFAVLYTSTLWTISVPAGIGLPDVDFHVAKILYSSSGHFFNDPVTSFPSIYPPVYHIMAGLIMRVSGSDSSWFTLCRFHVLMLVFLFMSVYLLGRLLFTPVVGLLSVLLFCGVFDMPNWSGMFLPTPFLLALAVIINSVALTYLGFQGRSWYLYLAGLAAGLAVTIWPAFLPVGIALPIVVFLTMQKGLWRPTNLLKFVLPFSVFPIMVWLPQYLLLSKHGLLGHHSIGQFKGIPGVAWFSDFAARFILLGGFDQNQQWVTVLFGMIYVVLIFTAFLGFRSLREETILKKKFLGYFLFLMLISLPVVDYVFSSVYSRRVQVLLSTVLVILAGYYLVAQLKARYRVLVTVFVVLVVASTSGWNIYQAHSYVMEAKIRYDARRKETTHVLEFIKSKTSFGEYVFATGKIYRSVIFGNIIRFNLVAHRDGSYYSLDPILSEKMLTEYESILNSGNFNFIRGILKQYNVRYILINNGEEILYPGIKQLSENCRRVYHDGTFAVFRL